MNSIQSRIISILVAALLATTASANTASWVQVPIPPELTELDGFVTNDLTLNTTSDWTIASLQIDLTSGSIYQDAFGNSHNAASPAISAAFPSVVFDTYVSDPHGGTSTAGPAICTGGLFDMCGLKFDTESIDLFWSGPSADAADTGTFSIARVTLSPDANGSATVTFKVAAENNAIGTDFLIQNGQIVPEPVSFALLGLGRCGAAAAALNAMVLAIPDPFAKLLPP